MEEQEKFKSKEEEQYQEERHKEVAHNSFKTINQEVRGELEEQLQELEVVRKRYWAKYKFRNTIFMTAIILFIVSIFLIIILGTSLQPEFSTVGKGIAILIGVFLVGVLFQFLKKKVEQQYEHHFKYTVLERIVDLFFSDLRYTPKRMIAEADFKSSHIEHTFMMPYQKYIGEDYFEGTYRGYPISFSEVVTSYTKKVVKKRINETTTTYIRTPLFNGLFFMLEMPEATSLSSFWGICPTYGGQPITDFSFVEEEFKEVMLGASFADKTKKREFTYQLLEGSIPVNPKLISAVGDLGKKLGEPIWVTYNGGRLYIGISTLLELSKKILKSMEGQSIVKQTMLLGKLQEKDSGLYLFSPPDLKVSVLDNKDVILKPMQEIQSCLDIVDEVLLLFNQVRELED